MGFGVGFLWLWMETGDSNCLGTKKGKKAGVRKTWRPHEEAILIKQLKELVSSGNWKTDNGFGPGYLQKLEEKMWANIHGTDIRAFPHINFKILTWKKHHECIQLALGETGCGFNTSIKILDCTNITWAKVIRKDPTVSGMRYKPWPYYEDWMEVFGNDCVVGEPAEDVMDVVVEFEAKDVQPQVGASEPSASNVAEDEFEMESESHEPTVDMFKSADASQSSSKKGSHAESFGNKEMIKALGDIFKSSDDRLGDIVKSIGCQYESNSAQTRKDVFNMLESFTDLSLDELLDSTDMLSKNTQRLEMFTGLPEAARSCYIRRLLDGDFDNHV
ncbi:hypothetical protein ACS0TY_027311 [Phlomoides rotata]